VSDLLRAVLLGPNFHRDNEMEPRFMRAPTVDAVLRAYFDDDDGVELRGDEVRFAGFLVGTVKPTTERVPADSVPRQWLRNGEMGPPEEWTGPSNPTLEVAIKRGIDTTDWGY